MNDSKYGNHESLVVINNKSLHYDYLNGDLTKSLMTHDEIQFLIHLIKEKNPKKILEIGVAEGGGTLYILQNMGNDAHLYSVDISNDICGKTVGHIPHDLCDPLLLTKWTTFFGKDIIECIDKIGGDIDMVILDTVHSMPGEFLSFFVVLPFMKNNSTLILHDIHENYVHICNGGIFECSSMNYCCTILFSTITSPTKYILKDDCGDRNDYLKLQATYAGISNIGAFIVDKTTKEHIHDLFNALYITWSYNPFIGAKKTTLNKEEYSQFIKKNYSEICSHYFDECINMHEIFFKLKEKNERSFSKKWFRDTLISMVRPFYYKLIRKN